MDWSTRNQLQITGRDSLLTKGLIRASLFAQYHTSILLYGFNPNFPKTVSLCLCPKSSLPVGSRQLIGSSVPMGYPYAPRLSKSIGTIISCPSAFWRNFSLHACNKKHARQPSRIFIPSRPLFNFLFPICNEHGFKIFYRTLKPDPCHLQVSGNVRPLACPKLGDTFARSSITDLPDARRFVLLHADQKITSRRLSSASAS